MRRQTCFVLMPFSADFDATYENAIRPAVTQQPNLQCVRADEIYGPRPIMADIWRSIQRAGVLIADLTGRNPNVLYERGLAHACRKPVIMIVQSISDIPFDLRAIRCLVYTNDRAGRALLSSDLAKTLSDLTNRLGGRRNYDFAVLSPESKTSKKKTIAILSADAEPDEIIQSMRDRATQLRAKHIYTAPTVDVNAAVELLDGQPREVIGEARRFLYDFIGKADVSLLYRFIDHGDAEMRAGILQIITTHGYNKDAEQLILANLATATDRERDVLLVALAGVATEETIKRSVDLVRAEALASPASREAFWLLCSTHEIHASAISVIADTRVIESLSTIERCLVLDTLNASDDSVFYGERETRYSAKRLLDLLSADENVDVRGRAAALYIRLAQIHCEGCVKSEMWAFLAGSSRGAIEVFLDEVLDHENKDATFLRPADARQLIECVAGDSFLENRIVWWLHENGDGCHEVADFMYRVVANESENQLWALAYFARLPSAVAETACKEILAHHGDVTIRVLAAICLARCKHSEAAVFVLQNVETAYGWVRLLARPVLSSICLESRDRRQRARAKELLESIAKGD